MKKKHALEKGPMLCDLCNQTHVIFQQKVDHDSEDEEWDRHTESYRAAHESFVTALEHENCTEGERRLESWQRENHDRLCCLKRHFGPSVSLQSMGRAEAGTGCSN